MAMAFQSARNSTWLILAVGAVFLCAGTGGFPQSEAKPVLRGMVVDQIGAVVANLTVEISARPADSTAAQFEKQLAVIPARTDYQGQFSASLLPGSYEVCVPRFPKACRTIVIEKDIVPEYLVLKISPTDQIHDPTLPDSRFQKIAGPSAKNCGHVLMDKNPSNATACAMHAFKHHKPFYVIYDEHCIDCFSARGLVWNTKGEPYSISFDSMGITYDLPPSGFNMPDDSDTAITSCSQPVRVYINEQGELDCFKERELWERRIAGGSREGLLSAGETGYQKLIPALKKRLADPESDDDPEDKEAIGMALAKLGDRKQMQALLCELHTGNPTEMQAVALDKISYVGGWYAIRIYRELLTPVAEVRFTKAKLRVPQSDIVLSEPRWWALSSLPKVTPYPLPDGIDYGFNLAEMQEYSQKWLAWIQQNGDRLKKLQPTGAGVDFSGKSCK
jgi:hypothetical protein